MKLIGIFKDNKLIDHSTSYQDNAVKAYKEAIAFERFYRPQELTAVVFEDDELVDFINSGLFMPTKRVDIYRDRINLIQIVPTPMTMDIPVDWKSCSDEILLEAFNEEEISKIAENKEYYDSLGAEKFNVGYEFNWPHDIPPKTITAEITKNEENIYKTILGVVVEDVVEEV